MLLTASRISVKSHLAMTKQSSIYLFQKVIFGMDDIISCSMYPTGVIAVGGVAGFVYNNYYLKYNNLLENSRKEIIYTH